MEFTIKEHQRVGEALCRHIQASFEQAYEELIEETKAEFLKKADARLRKIVANIGMQVSEKMTLAHYGGPVPQFMIVIDTSKLNLKEAADEPDAKPERGGEKE